MTPSTRTPSSPASAPIPLDLHTQWFTFNPPKFPYPSLRTYRPIARSTYTWESIGSFNPPGSQDSTLIGAVQWDDDGGVTKIKVEWNTADVDGTARGEWKGVYPRGDKGGNNKPEPEQLGHKALQLAAKWYNPHILAYARQRLGGRVGDGECWTLAAEALKAAEPKAIAEGHEPPMRSRGRVHGQLILEWEVGGPLPMCAGILEGVGVTGGDILEMKDVHVQHRRSEGGFVFEENARMEVHTAVVSGVEGNVIKVIEQNARAKRIVCEGAYNLKHMRTGWVRIYRPVGGSGEGEGRRVDLRKMCEEW